MKSPAYHATVAAALGAMLLITGCRTPMASKATPRSGGGGYQFAVMDKSKGLEVTPELLAELRSPVVEYLKEEGLDRAGEYIVKVNLTPDLPEDKGRWVVLRINRLPSRTYTLLSVYPGADDYYPYDFYGYYNYGYPSFMGYGYYDPFGYGGYIPPFHAPVRNYRPRDGDKHPPANRPRWDGKRPGPDRSRPDHYHPRTPNPRHDDRGRSHANKPGGSGRGHDRDGGSHAPPPPRPPPPANNPPAQDRNPVSRSVELMEAR